MLGTVFEFFIQKEFKKIPRTFIRTFESLTDKRGLTPAEYVSDRPHCGITPVFIITFFYKNVRPKLKNMLRTYYKLGKGEELLFCILYKTMEILCFSANVRQCDITD